MATTKTLTYSEPKDENRFYLIEQFEFDLLITPENSKPVAEIYTDHHVSIKDALMDVFGEIPRDNLYHIIRASKWDAMTA